MKHGEYTIYIHINKINNKMYCGITKQVLNNRWKNGLGYRNYSNNNIGYFYRAIKKYGWDNFGHEVIASGLTKQEAENFEILLIDKLKLNRKEFGYNIANGGNTIGKHSIETKCKISISNKGKSKHNEESRRKISEGHKGYKHTDEWKKNMSKRISGKNHPMYGKTGENSVWYGKHHTEITKQKISNKNKGKKRTEEQKVNISNAHKGKQVGLNNTKSKCVICNNIFFESITICATYLGTKRRNVSNWLNEKYNIPEKYKILNLRYATEDEINKYKKLKEFV